MKRILIILFLTCCALRLPAQILISFKTDSTCKTDTIIVPLKVQELRQCASFRIEFSFQDDIVHYDSLYFRNPALAGLTAFLNGNNRLVLEWTSASALPFGTGNIAKIQFTALQSGTSLLSFDAAQTYFKDEQGNPLTYLYNDGILKVHPRG
ncbi:MAG TPA: cohesin domain-containing protein, partial [Bacteroidales bacterium]|nr:cohesin domain-containing protein [Bacteroidales bacterium]